ncbi:hypothetical protein B0T10DRAFT_575368 [Thelonectria olida]|uniref:Uncharacterized protein n=1 Tax=Thelonectria olida TaxID=1576542 RepID=A0A9P8W155_9HYPO|nr:hypothetical protein B0T10DRAFT_575368 [Thelonectria olida]
MQRHLRLLFAFLFIFLQLSFADCADCKNAMGEVYYGPDDFYTSTYEEYSYTIDPVSSSILESQSQRNKTAEIPTVTLASSSLIYETPSVTPEAGEPYSTTIYGMTPISLPPMVSETEAASIGSSLMRRPMRAVGCAGVLAVWMY